MERKDYLREELTKEEKLYLQTVISNTKKRYIRDNYEQINHTNIDFSSCINTSSESILEIVINKCVEEIETAIEFEKIVSNEKLYHIVKALSLREKVVLFSLYKENKSINQIAKEMRVERTTVWRIKGNALDKIMKKLLGGN